ncbi:MAG: DHA2 family efflux MFS transporter permease subunit [Holophaga sp.]|nr:DHA2 family efflux MFS transporter permease subunit [Holophaga sp.]
MIPLDRADEPLAPGLWKIVVVAMLGPLLSNLDATVVNVSLSSLAHHLHATLATIQWVTSGYLLALALMLPLTGWLVDRIGAKRLYLICFSGFTLASMLCGLAWSSGSLIGFRVLQGMAGGLLAPMAQMMTARVAGKHMARVMGYASVPVLLGPVLGPVLAGAILQHASWRWLFYINLPIGVLAVVLAGLVLPDDRGEAQPRVFDLSGFLLLSPGLVLLLYGGDHANQRGGILLFLLALLLLAGFVGHARRAGASALIDLRLFRSGIFSCAAVTQFLVNGIAFAGQMLVPFFFVLACHLSPARTGWMMAPVGLGMMVCSPFQGALSERFGIRPVAAAGALLALLGTVPFALMASHGLLLPVAAIALLARGAGLGSIGIASISAAYASIPTAELPMATTAINIVQRFGGPTVTTLVSTFLALRLGSAVSMAHPSAAFAEAFWLLSGLHALCLAATLGLPRVLGLGGPGVQKALALSGR